MGALLVSVLTWFTGFLISSVIARLAAFVVISGLSASFVGWLTSAVTSSMTGAPAEVLAIFSRMGVDDALGILLGAIGLAASLSWSFRPGRAGG